MSLRHALALASCLLPVSSCALAQERPARGSNVPRLYVAAGPQAETEIARLKTAIARLTGIQKVEAKPEFGAVTVNVDSDGASTESLITAAARSAGYTMRPVRARFFAVNGSTDGTALQKALQSEAGIEQVAVAAPATVLRVFGQLPASKIIAAAKQAGFNLKLVGSFVVAGPSDSAELAKLHTKLDKTAGVERVEMQPLGGGATMLIYGDVSDEALTKSAKSAGYDLWPLNPPRRGGSAEAPPVALPTLTPEAGRSTPPDFEARVLEERAILGQKAPEFTVKPMTSGANGKLSGFLAAGKPVVLIFGSCT